jgi:hypothetical protein
MNIFYTDKTGNSAQTWLPTAGTTASGDFADQALDVDIQNSLIYIAFKNSADNGKIILLKEWIPDNTDPNTYFVITGMPAPLGTSTISLLPKSQTEYLIASSNIDITGDPITGASINLWEMNTVSTNISSLSGFTYSISALGSQPNLQLASHLFSVGTDDYMLASYQGALADVDNLQPTMFILDTNFTIVGKILAGIAGNHVTVLPHVVVDTDNKVRSLAGIRTRLATQDGKLLTPQGITRVQLDFMDTNVNSTQLGDNLHIATGLVYDFDGQNVVEHGFHLFPEKPTASVTGGSLVSGSYDYVAVYEWVDVQGQVHQSAPSIPLNVSLSGSSKVTITVQSTPVTLKEGVEVALYRTLDTGTIYYRVTSADMGASTTQFIDEASDAIIEGNQFLYTTGGVIENISPPACSIVQKHSNRLFLAGLEDRNALWYSKESVTNEAVCFSDLFQLRVNPAGGPITALASLDDKLIIFKEDGIYYLAGQGPTDTGIQNDYTQPQFITSNVGCKNVNSIVVTQDGIMFQSDKGIWLLDRSLALTYIGAPVDDYNSMIVSSALLLPDVNQVRFTTNDRCLIYQNHLKRWSTFTNYEAQSATIWKGKYYFVTTAGVIKKEDSTKRADDATFYSLKIVTGWIKLGIQSRMHLYRGGFLGRTNGETVSRISKYVDYNDNIAEVKYFDTTQALDTSYFGDETYFGTATVFGADKDKTYQYTGF